MSPSRFKYQRPLGPVVPMLESTDKGLGLTDGEMIAKSAIRNTLGALERMRATLVTVQAAIDKAEGFAGRTPSAVAMLTLTECRLLASLVADSLQLIGEAP